MSRKVEQEDFSPAELRFGSPLSVSLPNFASGSQEIGDFLGVAM